MTEMRGLYLQSNQLMGSIPASLGGLKEMRNLWLQNNQLTGSIPASLGDAAGDKLEVGTAVAARFGVGQRYFPGEIEKVNGDGTYSILYDDGDRENNVGLSKLMEVRTFWVHDNSLSGMYVQAHHRCS
jgi:hypothetical protein